MKAGNRSWIGGMIVAALVLAVGAGSASALAPQVVTKAGKQKSGPFTHDLQHLNVPVGKAKRVYWQVKNKNGAPLDVVFDDAATEGPQTEGFRINWFRGKKNISSDVKGGGYEFHMKTGAKKLFSAVVRHRSNASPGFCLGGQTSGLAIIPDASYFTVNDNDCG
jgi:hypothetical protein